MTISFKGNSQGGVVEANGVAAANITSGTGIPFMKNKLINGEVTRINQRGVANWAAVANGAYGYDRWKKIDASNMTQIIEAGNFRPNTVHTLSGIGVTTQQITSPASGNWTLPNIPIAATNVQVEEGLEATPFEVRHIAFELALCQRYYERVGINVRGYMTAGGMLASPIYYAEKRVAPTTGAPLTAPAFANVNTSAIILTGVNFGRFEVQAAVSGEASALSGVYGINAEIP